MGDVIPINQGLAGTPGSPAERAENNPHAVGRIRQLDHYSHRTQRGLFIGVQEQSGSAYFVDGRAVKLLPGYDLGGAGLPLIDADLYRCRCGGSTNFRLPEVIRKLGIFDRVALVGDYASELFASWIYTVTLDKPTKPLLVLTGVPGSGKTSTARLMVRLREGRHADVLSMPKSDHDLKVVASRHRFLAIDNVDTQPRGWFMDTIAAAATGAQVENRKLWSDDSVATIKLRSGIVITSMVAPFNRADVADRAICFDMARRSGFAAESSLAELAERMRPVFCGTLLHDLNHLVEIEGRGLVKPEEFRMADYASVVRMVLVDKADEALRLLLETQSDLALRDDGIFASIRDALDTVGELFGGPGKIRGELDLNENTLDTRSARAFGAYLRRIAVPAAQKGVSINWEEDLHRKSYNYRISLIGS